MSIFKKTGDRLHNALGTTTKQLIWFYTINGTAMIWCSYVLAFMGKDQIAEALSSNVCTVVIGQIGFYLVSKTVENVFQYNEIFPHRTKDIVEPPVTSGNISVPVPPAVRTTSASVRIEETNTEEEFNNGANKLDIGADEEPD